MGVSEKRINLDEPRWDQSTYMGRAKHFFTTTNPLNLLRSNADLERARDIVTKYRKGEGLKDLTEDELWAAKHLYDSAFHPDTGEKMLVFGRMSAQVPMNMLITGAMMTWYKTTGAVVFWQWFNQSFNAAVNYTNRSGGSPVTVPQLATSYALATSSALATALGLNSLTKSMPPLIGRWVPFAAVAAANCVNIPLMRRHELTSGIPVFDDQNNQVAVSTEAAKRGITSVVISRICMCAPSMMAIPLYMNHLEKKGVLKRRPWISAPLQIALCGVILTFATPLCCALFPQKASVEVSKLEPSARDQILKLPNPPTVVYYNKGL
jgi:tricarboxylate carrier